MKIIKTIIDSEWAFKNNKYTDLHAYLNAEKGYTLPRWRIIEKYACYRTANVLQNMEDYNIRDAKSWDEIMEKVKGGKSK